MDISKSEMDKFRAHALDVYPEEAVALIKLGKIIVVDNISEDPLNSFLVDPKTIKKLKPDGVLHTHPYDPLEPREHNLDRRTPSRADMETRESMGLDMGFGIVAVDGVNMSDPLWLNHMEPILGRQFLYGYNDCYTIIRDYYSTEKGITLPYMPRAYGWWEGDDAQSMYMEHFTDAGFTQIDPRDIDIDDVVLMKVKSKVVNHGGVYVENNQLLHHLMNQLSTIQPYSDFKRFENVVLRYTK